MHENNNLMTYYTNQISQEYDEVMNELIDNQLFLHDPMIEDIENIGLSFLLADYNTFQAWADYENKTVAFTRYGLKSRKNTIIHELAHHICHLSKSGQGHCLEFAIINYCIRRRLEVDKSNDSKCYFDSYDIHQDKSYPIILINPCKFDSLIRCIEWGTISELAKKSQVLASKIRRKSVENYEKETQ